MPISVISMGRKVVGTEQQVFTSYTRGEASKCLIITITDMRRKVGDTVLQIFYSYTREASNCLAITITDMGSNVGDTVLQVFYSMREASNCLALTFTDMERKVYVTDQGVWSESKTLSLFSTRESDGLTEITSNDESPTALV